MAKQKSAHYVDNKKFLQAMIEWHAACEAKGEKVTDTEIWRTELLRFGEQRFSDGENDCWGQQGRLAKLKALSLQASLNGHLYRNPVTLTRSRAEHSSLTIRRAGQGAVLPRL